jgi:hypothetical protein
MAVEAIKLITHCNHIEKLQERPEARHFNNPLSIRAVLVPARDHVLRDA